jgi:hypothetical protein
VKAHHVCFIEYDTMQECLDGKHPSHLCTISSHLVLALTMHGTIMEGTSNALLIQLADRDHYERRLETQSNALLPLTPKRLFQSTGRPTAAFFDQRFFMVPVAPAHPMEYAFEVSGLSPAVTILQLCAVFSQYGQIIGIQLNTTSVGSHRVCSGTAIIRLYGSIQHRDDAYNCLNGAYLFPFDGPIFINSI